MDSARSFMLRSPNPLVPESPWGSNPHPSSSTTSRTPSACSSLTVTSREAPCLAALVIASRRMRKRFSVTSPGISMSSIRSRWTSMSRRAPRSSAVWATALASDCGRAAERTLMARRASSRARSAASASCRSSGAPAESPVVRRVLLAMNASSWARPSCNSRAIRRRSSAVACCSSVWWAAHLESASSRRWPSAWHRSTHSSGTGSPRVEMASTPWRVPSGQTGTQAPWGMPAGQISAPSVGPTSSAASRATTGRPVSTACCSGGWSSRGQVPSSSYPESSNWAMTPTIPSSITRYDARRTSEPGGEAMSAASRVPISMIAGGSTMSVSWRAATLTAFSWSRSRPVRAFDLVSRSRSTWMERENMIAMDAKRSSRRAVAAGMSGVASETQKTAATTRATTAVDSQRRP